MSPDASGAWSSFGAFSGRLSHAKLSRRDGLFVAEEFHETALFVVAEAIHQGMDGAPPLTGEQRRRGVDGRANALAIDFGATCHSGCPETPPEVEYVGQIGLHFIAEERCSRAHAAPGEIVRRCGREVWMQVGSDATQRTSKML